MWQVVLTTCWLLWLQLYKNKQIPFLCLLLFSPFLMTRTCTKCANCAAQTHGIRLTDDYFRKGPFPPQSLQFWRQCSLCRGTQAVAIGQGPSRICTRCHFGQESYHFRDRGIRLFLTRVWLQRESMIPVGTVLTAWPAHWYVEKSTWYAPITGFWWKSRTSIRRRLRPRSRYTNS